MSASRSSIQAYSDKYTQDPAEGLEVYRGPFHGVEEDKQLSPTEDHKYTTFPDTEYYNPKGAAPVGGSAYTQHATKNGYSEMSHVDGAESQAKPVWWKRKLRWIIAVVIIIAIIAVVVPVAITQSRESNDSSSSPTQSGTSTRTGTTPAASATAPAVSGSEAIKKLTGLTQIESYAVSSHVFFYQSGNGSLQYISQPQVRDDNDRWQGPRGGVISLDGALKPRNPTPLSTAYITIDENEYWYLFYVDEKDTVQGLFKDDSSDNNWRNADVGREEFIVSPDQQCTLAITNGRLYNQTGQIWEGGITIYATDSGSGIQQYIYNSNDDEWSVGRDFETALESGGVYIGQLGPEGYLITQSADQSLQIQTHDFRTNSTDEQVWNSGDESRFPNPPMDKTDICAGGFYVIYQDDTGVIRVNNGTGDSPDNFAWGKFSQVAGSEQDVLNGTSLTCWWYDQPSNFDGKFFSAVYQSNAGEVKESYIRYNDDGGVPNFSDRDSWRHQTLLAQPNDKA